MFFTKKITIFLSVIVIITAAYADCIPNRDKRMARRNKNSSSANTSNNNDPYMAQAHGKNLLMSNAQEPITVDFTYMNGTKSGGFKLNPKEAALISDSFSGITGVVVNGILITQFRTANKTMQPLPKQGLFKQIVIMGGGKNFIVECR